MCRSEDKVWSGILLECDKIDQILVRKSAAWVNPSDDEDFRSFGDSLYKVTPWYTQEWMAISHLYRSVDPIYRVAPSTNNMNFDDEHFDGMH